MQPPQQHRRPPAIIAAAVAALFGLCLCVAVITVLLPHESARILRGGSPVLVPGDLPPPPTVPPPPTATLAPTSTAPPSPPGTPLPTATLAPTSTPQPSLPATPTPTSSPATTATLVPWPAGVLADAVRAQLTEVVDGDTIHVVTGGLTETVRYIGIDTPERGEPGHKAATDANAALLAAGDLFLLSDTSDRDNRGRLLRYVYTAAGLMVNRELVAQGWAQPVEYRPDTQFANEFLLAATQAAEARRGFWSGAASDDAMPYALTTASADIRAGPGVSFGVNVAVPQDTPLTVYGSTPAGDWLRVRAPDLSKGWIAADAVRLNVPAGQVPVEGDLPATPTAPTAADGPVQIVQLNGHTRDEIVVVQNLAAEPVDLSGWSIQSYGGSACQPMAEQVYAFPAGFQLAAGNSVLIHSGPDAAGEPPDHLVWTVENIWNNSGDRADLRDAGGQTVSTWAYGGCR